MKPDQQNLPIAWELGTEKTCPMLLVMPVQMRRPSIFEVMLNSAQILQVPVSVGSFSRFLWHAGLLVETLHESLTALPPRTLSCDEASLAGPETRLKRTRETFAIGK